MPTVKTDYHSTLATYFASKPLYLDEPTQDKLNIRKLDEQPWQQIKCGSFVELEKTLVDVEFFLSLSNKDRFEIWRYWQSMPSNQKNLVKKYSDTLSVWRSLLLDSKKYELALNELAHYYYVNGEELESSKLIEESLGLSMTLYPPNDIRIAIRKNNYAATLCHMRDYQKAEALFLESLPIYTEYYGKDHEKTWGVREGIAICHFCTDRISIGIMEEKECLEWFSMHYGNDNLKTLVSIQNIADALRRGNFNKEAKRFYEKAYNGFIKKFGKKHPYTISCTNGLTLVNSALSKTNKITNNIEDKLELRQLKNDPSSIRTKALEQLIIGNYSESERLLILLLKANYEVSSIHCHLARLKILTNNLGNATEHIEEGMKYRKEATSYVIARLLWLKIALTLIEDKPFTNILGQLKTVLQNNDAVMEWNMQLVLDHIKTKVIDEHYALLTSLVDAMSFEEKHYELDKIEMWRNIEPQPID